MTSSRSEDKKSVYKILNRGREFLENETHDNLDLPTTNVEIVFIVDIHAFEGIVSAARSTDKEDEGEATFGDCVLNGQLQFTERVNFTDETGTGIFA